MRNDDVGPNKVSLIVKIVGMGLIAIVVVWAVLGIKRLAVGPDVKHPVATKVEVK